MRESSSHHTCNLYFRERNGHTGCLLPSCFGVDFLQLAECLSSGSTGDERDGAADSEPEPEQKAVDSRKRVKGRPRKEAGRASGRPAKLAKVEKSSTGERAVVDDSAVPIFRHTFEIDFDVCHFNPNAPKELLWVSPGRDFIHTIARKRNEQAEAQEQTVFNLGTVYPHAYGDKVHACTIDPSIHGRVDKFPASSLLTLPTLIDDVKEVDHDFNTYAFRNILASAYRLQQDKRARISGPLTIIVEEGASLDDPRALPLTLHLEITVSLLETHIFEPLTTFKRKDSEVEEAQRRVLTYAFGPGLATPDNYTGRTDMHFFLSCLHPAAALPSTMANEAAQPAELLPQLLPFQRRTVGWLLSRERKQITSDGHIEDAEASTSQLPLFWEKVSPVEGKTWYLNRITGCLLNEQPPDESLGGILAEEPGLGKTLESIALIMLTPAIDRSPLNSRWDPKGVIDVKEVKTTLIVTPASLSQQWADELKLHAPSLKVLVYEGWANVPVPITSREAQDKALRKMRAHRRGRTNVTLDDDDLQDDDDIADIELTEAEKEDLKKAADHVTWCEFVNQYDVCITTYNNLQQDLGVARPPLQRPRRKVAKYVDIYRDRSPLVMVEWNRVIMDEVQMVGGGKTEEMVSLIPRLSSFAVSGTPARSSVEDLIHVIKFLRIDSVVNSAKAWTRLQAPAFAGYFKHMFEQISVRTTKAKVQNELTIPEQRRFVVPIELGKVEKTVYDENLEQALHDLGLDLHGIAASSGWEVDVTILRTWMRKLRGICTHPQVGKLARHNDRLAKAGSTLKSIGEVLDDMKDQNWRKMMDEKKSKIQILVKRAQLIQQEDNPQKYKRSLEILLDAKREMIAICSETADVIEEHDAKGEKLKKEAAAAAAAQRLGAEDGQSKGKGKQIEREKNGCSMEDTMEDGLPKTQAGEEHRYKKNALQSRLRDAYIVLHQIHFLLGDVYHALGDSYNTKEDEAYSAADDLRKQLLKTTRQVATQSISHLKLVALKNSTTKEDMQIPYCGKGGDESEDLLDEANDIIEVLNKQTELLFRWRERILKLLSESLSAEDGDVADGEEYSRTLETQGEAEAFLQAYAALLADRREVLIAERTALAVHDVRERKIRLTVAAQRAQWVATDIEKGALLDEDEIQPEHEVLQSELTASRKAIHKDRSGRAIKSILVDLQGVVGSHAGESDPEKDIAKEWVGNLKALIKEQSNFHDKIEADMVPFRKAFNDRIMYFRQLQELSDSVCEAEWEGDLAVAIANTHTEEITLNEGIKKYHARQRYLKNLTSNDDEEDEDNTCILCKSDFVRGFVTQCAHVYCEGCLKAWVNRKEGKACPVCRVIIDPDQVQLISMGDKKAESPDISSSSKRRLEDTPQSSRVIEYNSISPEVLEELKKIDCLGSYGTKIETLVRHLLYLEEVDPGCKSIVFSAWADSLYILERALTQNGIQCLRIDQKKGKQNAAKLFKTDHRIRVLLLHGERENAGLNVTCASRVFLTESVVQHSFELQAIARIDRLGQTRPTEVYCYYAENTVEKNILDLAAKRGLSLYTKDHAVGTLKVTPFEMDQNRQIDSPVKKNNKQKDQKGDFIFKTDDMLAILFPHLFEDVEYLIPEGMDVDIMNGDFEDGNDNNEQTLSEQPVAGPSRL